jgi:hypothetical protein
MSGNATEETRYQKLDARVWADKKYRDLSPLKPSGQALFLYLVLGPHNTSVPGLFKATEGGLADELGWTPKEFRRCWQEIEQRGMARADWRAHVVWLPNAVRFNAPQSPNGVKSWPKILAEVPECALKVEACLAIRASIPDGDTWQDAVRTAFGACLAESLAERQTESLPPSHQGSLPGHHAETSSSSSSSSNSSKNPPVFTPPTVEEVRAYCQERGNSVDPERFIDFYASKGWMVGKNKMRDWKAAMRGWEKNEGRSARGKGRQDGAEVFGGSSEFLRLQGGAVS